MFVELKYDEFSIVETLFNKNRYQIPALAVLNRNFPGKVFVDNKEKPEIALVWAISRWSYISFKKLLPKHKSFMESVFNSKILPILLSTGEKHFEIYTDHNIEWDRMLNESFSEYKLDKHYENTFVLNQEKFKTLSSNIEIQKDIEICENAYPIIPKDYRRFVESNQYEKKTFGIAIKKNGEIVSQCVNNGFVYKNNYFIDLDTFTNEERNKGYGTLVSYSLISNLLRKGLLPLWETTNNNLPSQRVAAKLGFEKTEEYPVYSITSY
ncbi:GNAT family N-acetyltransferase [Mesobacillus zeae]|uniref:GNAT family N-acetyltransferase n=1 Tax=Mesobacillus zeae TaxID=1917180 RepID=A0A398AXE3_9BACI|nr:GNAT family N-acetyltransferase [Mesobacillus zeae]RID82317.1 GNAT family N-acetyltransferase [Mesobacillus zeae]